MHRLALGLSLLVSSYALAQEETKTDAPVAAAPSAQNAMRFRGGIRGGGGYFLPAGLVDFGAAGELGLQINDQFAAYLDLGYIFGVGFGGSASSSGGSISVSAVGYWHAGLLAEMTVSDSFYFGGGPMVAGGGWAGISQAVTTSGSVEQVVIAAGDNPMPGLDLRVGIGFGKPQPENNGRRKQFTIGLDLHMVLATVTSVSQSAGGGGVSQSVKTGDKIFGITPMLMFGYAAK